MAMTMQAAAANVEAFQPSYDLDEQAASEPLNLKHECEYYDLTLEDLCDQAMDEQATSVLLDLERDCEASGDGSRTPCRSWPDLEIPQVDIEPLPDWAPEVDIGLLCVSALKELEHCQRYTPKKASQAAGMAMTMQAAAADIDAFQPGYDLDEQAASESLNLKHDCEDQYYDLALEDLCDLAMDEQAASVLLDLQRDCEASGDDSRTPCRSWPDLEIPQVDIEPLLDWAPEVDIGLLCVSALKDLEEHCQRYTPKNASRAAGMAMTMQAAAADVEAVPPSYDLDEQTASVSRKKQYYDLALEDLCDQAMDEQVASVLLDLERDCAASGDGSLTPCRSWPDLEMPQVDIEPLPDWAPEVDIGLLRGKVPEGDHACAYDDLRVSALKDLEEHCQRYAPKKASHAAGMAMTMQAAAADAEAFQAGLEECDDLDEQAASMLLDLEYDCDDLHCDLALEGLCDQAVDEQAASALLDLERDCEVDTEPPPDWAQEADAALLRNGGAPGREHDRAYYELCAAALRGLEEHRQRLLGELESAGQQLFCGGLRRMLAETARKMWADYLLWAL